ncbi:MAG TPA: CHRD domain-containing protein [Verrucomicrobiae bacterium]
MARVSGHRGRLGDTRILTFLVLLLAYERGWAQPWRLGQPANGRTFSYANCDINPSGHGARNAFGEAAYNELARLYGNSIGGTQPFWSAPLGAIDSGGDGAANCWEFFDPQGTRKTRNPNPPGLIPSREDANRPPPPNQLPTVTISTPSSGTTLIGSAVGVIMSATASDADGTVENVTFFDGATPLGSVAGAPFTLRCSLEAGTHALEATATDNGGATAVSAKVLVTIMEPLPIKITAIQPGPAGMDLSWTGGSGPVAVQKRKSLAEPWCTVLPMGVVGSSRFLPATQAGFYRLLDTAALGAVPFNVALGGAAERPDPVTTDARGAGTLLMEGNTLSFDISYTNLSGPATGAHIHGPAGAAQSADALVDLRLFSGGGSGASGRLLGSVVLTPEEKLAALAGLTYLNLHTEAHGSGEIRGQLTPDLSALAPCSQPIVSEIKASYRLDPWLLGGTYAGGLWASPAVLGPAVQGASFTVETRADGLNQGNPVVITPTWTSADPRMVTVSPGHGRQVTITVHRAGQTGVDIVCQGARKTLTITATPYAGPSLSVAISQ